DTGIPAIEGRRPAMEATFAALASVGVARSNLMLAWDFTTASERGLAARMLHIRDAALAQLGDRSPTFTVTSVKENPTKLVARQVAGTFTVPNFLTGDGGPGQRFNVGRDGLPEQNGEIQAPFLCDIPDVALADTTSPARIAEYGHGLLGSEREITA